MDSNTIHIVVQPEGAAVQPESGNEMRMSALSARSGLPVPTIKYYLREGLLPPGRATAPNQASYDETHVHRLRLIRTLMEVGGLGLAQVREVTRALEDELLSLHDLLGIAHHAIGAPARDGPVPDDVRLARADVGSFLDDLGWEVSSRAPGRRALADALVALRRLGRHVEAEVFGRYAATAYELAAWELDQTAADREASRSEVVEDVVIGTVVFEAALVALRRLAQEHHSAIRFGAGAEGSGERPGT